MTTARQRRDRTRSALAAIRAAAIAGLVVVFACPQAFAAHGLCCWANPPAESIDDPLGSPEPSPSTDDDCDASLAVRLLPTTSRRRESSFRPVASEQTPATLTGSAQVDVPSRGCGFQPYGRALRVWIDSHRC